MSPETRLPTRDPAEVISAVTDRHKLFPELLLHPSSALHPLGSVPCVLPRRPVAHGIFTCQSTEGFSQITVSLFFCLRTARLLNAANAEHGIH